MPMQNWTHGTESAPFYELKNAAERYDAESGTNDLETDVSDVKVVKRQRLASSRFGDNKPRLNLCLNVVKFIVRMKVREPP